MMIPSQKANDWFWRNLYVPANGRLKPSGYLGVLIRCAFIFAIATQILAALTPALMTTFNSSASGARLPDFTLARIGALLVVAWPLMSAFIRRRNDFRPDLLQKLQVWALGFPVLMVALFCIPLAEALGIPVSIDPSLRSSLQTLFFALLIGAAFVPGGDQAPLPRSQPIARPAAGASRAETVVTASQRAAIEAIASQLAQKGAAQPRHVAQPRAAATAKFPNVIERGRKMPEQGRVKPGWFS